MGFFRRLFGGEAKSGVSNSLELFREIYGAGRVSDAGETITASRALDVATVLACCRVIADGIAQVPFRVYRATETGREIARDHRLFRLLHRKPNAWMTSFEFRETLAIHVLLTGNAFVFVNRVGISREVIELIIIDPGRVEVEMVSDQNVLRYRVRSEKGATREFPPEAIWHLRGPSWNGWMGLEGVKLARNAIGLSLALEKSQSGFYRNGARMSGLYSVEGNISPEQYRDLRAWMDKYRVGGENESKPMLLDRGAKFVPTAMTGVDAQHLETRKHQIEEICREFRVFPQMVGHAGDQTPTFASAEQFFLAHVVHTLMPWYERIEQSADCNLLSEADVSAGYYTKFTPNALMRGAAKDRAEFYTRALGSGGAKGWMTQNEVREAEDMNRSDDPEADKLPQQASRVQSSETQPASPI